LTNTKKKLLALGTTTIAWATKASFPFGCTFTLFLEDRFGTKEKEWKELHLRM
jgi:hypothetical protein